MHKILQVVEEKKKENPNREHKKVDKFFVCSECKRVYEEWKNTGSRNVRVQQTYLNEFPTIGLLHKVCNKCRQEQRRMK